MNERSSEFDPVDDLAEEFLARYRNGERPSLGEYTARHPELAERIRAVFPALVAMEEIGAGTGRGNDHCGDPLGSRAQEPRRLGDFILLRRVGAGGMGIVYEAEHASLKSRMALKVMHPRFRADRAYVRRFQTEARSAAKLHHTNIVSVFDYGEQDGVCYYAMQYIVGVGLERVLEDVRRLRAADSGDRGAVALGEGNGAAIEVDAGLLTAVSRGLVSARFVDVPAAAHVTGADSSPIAQVGAAAQSMTGDDRIGPDGSASAPTDGRADSDSSSLAGQSGSLFFREVARLGAQIADALEYAHRQGVIHRDIKPSNLLLDVRGNVWVTDFGLAKLVEGDELTQSHDLVGTLRFMAPERFRGVTDPLGDVYSLGATLYELLTLKPAFAERDQARLINQIAHESPVPLRQHDQRIPRDLETLVLKALAKEPKDRFTTAAELGDELRRYLESRPIRSRPVGSAERLWRWCRRSPAVAALTALAAALTVFVAIVSTIAAWTYKASLSRAEKAEHAARLALGNSLVSEGAALQRTGSIGQRFDSLDRLERAAQVLGADLEGRSRLPAIRNHAIAALALVDFRASPRHAYGDVLEVNGDAALDLYAAVERSGKVIVSRLDDGRELACLPGPETSDFWHAASAFSPDGDLVATTYLVNEINTLVRIWHVGRQELLCSLPGRGRPAFHPDGRRVLFGAAEGGIAVWDRDRRRVVRRLPLDFTPNYVAVDPQGRRLAVSNFVQARRGDQVASRVAILEFETGRVLFDWRTQVGNGVLAWSADGKLLAVAGAKGDARVYLWNVCHGALSSILQGHSSEIIGAQFARSGYLLATGSWDGTTRLWNGVSGESLAVAPGNLLGSFSIDDRRLAYVAGGKVGVWDIDVASECRTLHPRMLGNRSEVEIRTVVRAAEVSPDGALLATGDWNGVRLWAPDTGRELAHLKAGFCETVLFHPDGQSLISSGGRGSDLYRWPIRPEPDRGPGAICIGPPEILQESGGEDGKATWLPDRKTLAIIDNVNARVLLIDSSHPHPAWSRATALDSGENHRMTTVAVSPNGRWLTVGGWKEAGVRVWDLRRRRLERILRPDYSIGNLSFFVGFSPDGRWLISATGSDVAMGSYHFWRVGTWELDHSIDGERNAEVSHSPAFTHDGRLMALAIAPDQVLLADAATGRELARLTTLQPVAPTPLAFSPDGTRLIASTNQETVVVWELRQIREQLAKIGLDWDAPPLPTATGPRDAAGPVAPPRPVRVVGEVVDSQARRAAELALMNRRLAARADDAEALIHRGWLLSRQNKWSEAITDLERFLRLRPGDSDALWLIADAYEEGGQLTRALAAFDRVVEQAPEDYEAQLQRGLLALALAQPGLAVLDLSRVVAARPDWDRARYHRAQALIRLGRHREALADLEIGIPKNPGDHALFELRAKVREALGDRDDALADKEKAGSLVTNNPKVLNDRAWFAATRPIARRDPERAVMLARRAVAFAPGAQVNLNTLGVALYRTGEYAEAISVLKQSLAAGKGEFAAFDLFFLAMAHHHLGHHLEARGFYDQAVRWLGAKKGLATRLNNELAAFRTEAEDTLAHFADDLPDHVFADPR